VTRRVRAFRAEDAALVAPLVEALNAEESYRRGTCPDASALAAAYLGSAAAGRMLVAVDAADRPLGYVTLHTTYETEFAARGAYLGDLYVAPAARRQGLGRALVAAAVASVREEGGVFLWWTALRRNAAAHAFYRALGAEDEPIRAFVLAREAFDGLAAG
jgi:ribosomal protein S18 acetylase RimI-like enzyme